MVLQFPNISSPILWFWPMLQIQPILAHVAYSYFLCLSHRFSYRSVCTIVPLVDISEDLFKIVQNWNFVNVKSHSYGTRSDKHAHMQNVKHKRTKEYVNGKSKFKSSIFICKLPNRCIWCSSLQIEIKIYIQCCQIVASGQINNKGCFLANHDQIKKSRVKVF